MPVLSPLLQTEEIKQKIIDERDERHRRSTCGYRDQGSVGKNEDVEILNRILSIIENPEIYKDGLGDGWSNHAIADKLRSYLILSDDDVRHIKESTRRVKSPRTFSPHT